MALGAGSVQFQQYQQKNRVIPAHAGIHGAASSRWAALCDLIFLSMDPGVRRDDDGVCGFCAEY
ncbi:MAG: hypothetical protein EBQ89_05975 [Alphaproteobacteria bacterium]|nr:hypothetical protein [Alphaproteobacteria bacterium]